MKSLKFNIKSILLCWLVGTLASCSSAFHLRKAIKKNPNIIQNSVDTVKIETPGITKIIHAKDSIVVDEEKFYIKAIANGDSLSLYFNIYADTVFIIKEKVVFNAPKTRQENRHEFKLEKMNIRKKKQFQKQEIKSKTAISKKQIKHESRKGFSIFYFLVSFLLGFVTAVFVFRWAVKN
jgi:uncharacterized ubiquitin-like protein YukD